jgi:hypothetical protein
MVVSLGKPLNPPQGGPLYVISEPIDNVNNIQQNTKTGEKYCYIFSRPQPGCHLPSSPWPGILKLFPAR